MSSLRRLLLAAAISGGAVDPYITDVGDLLHFENDFVSDQITGLKGHVWTRSTTNLTIDAAWSKNGAKSLKFGVGGGILTTPAHADFCPADGDFCVEGFLSGTAVANDRCIVDTRNGTAEGIAIYSTTTSTAGKLTVANNSAIIASASSTWTPSGEHWAVYRLNGVLYGAIAGVVVFSVADTRTYGASGLSPVAIGGNYLGTQLASGNLDDFRWTNGYSRYGASNFVPPTSFADDGPKNFNPRDKAAELKLSNFDATVTRSTTNDGSWRSLRSVTSHNSGFVYAECSNDVNGSTNGAMIFGVGAASASLSSYPGSGPDSWGNQGNNPTTFVYLAGTAFNFGGEPNISGGGYDKVAINFATGKGWFGNSAVSGLGWYNGGDPAAGTNPTFTFTPGTTLYLMLGQQHSPQKCTLRTNAADQVGTRPAGSTAWG